MIPPIPNSEETLMRIRCSGAALLILVACGGEPPASQSATEGTRPRPAISAAAMTAPTAASATDPFAAEYEDIRLQLARWDGDTAKIDDARERLKAIIAKDRNYAPAYVGLARAEALSGYKGGREYEPAGLDRAAKFVAHAIKLRPDYFDAYVEKAWIASFRGDIDIVEEAVRRADELKPGHPRVKLVRAAVADDVKTAARLAKEVIAESKSTDDKIHAYSVLVDVYQYGRHLDEADAAYREVLKLRPDAAWAHGNYAGFLLQRDDIDGAIREAEAAMKIRKYPLGLRTLVLTYIAKADQLWDANRIAESATYVAKIGSLGNDQPDLMFALGKFYERAAIRGRDASMRQKALASYRRVLELNPRHMEAERAVARLERR